MKQPNDYLIWVGGQYYPSPDDFIKEAESLGCCRRIPHLPKNLVPGMSRVWVAHERKVKCAACKGRGIWLKVQRDDGGNKIKNPDGSSVKFRMTCSTCNNNGVLKQPVIFGFFVVQGIDLVVDDPKKIEEFKEQRDSYNIKPVSMEQAAAEPVRGCGRRHPGMYLVANFSEGDMDKLKDIVENIGGAAFANLKGPLVVLASPVALPPHYGRGHLRGYKEFDPKTIGFNIAYPPPDKLPKGQLTIKLGAEKVKS